MARLNRANQDFPETHEGGRAVRQTSEQELSRAVLSCLLWENTFYESGHSIADRITDLCDRVQPEFIAELAVKARHEYRLRHVPLLLLDKLSEHTGRSDGLVRATIANVLSRADEPAEFLSIYWRNGRKPVSAQVKAGIALALHKFDEYQLAKYNRPNAVKLRDVFRIARPKPEDEEQAELWKRVVSGTLETPNTWETRLSGGEDKKAVFTELLKEGKLGYMALIRNLRNMENADVDRNLITKAILERRGAERLFPYRFLAAVEQAPSFSGPLSEALLMSIENQPRFEGTSVVIVDVSGSMSLGSLSKRSRMRPVDAAASLAALMNGDDVRCFAFADRVAEVPHYPGLAGIEAIRNHNLGGGTRIATALDYAAKKVRNYDRIILITDMQASDDVLGPPKAGKGSYIINVQPYKNAIGYGGWTHIDGWSENTLRYIHQAETG